MRSQKPRLELNPTALEERLDTSFLFRLCVAVGWRRATWSEMLEVSDGGADWAEVGSLGEGYEGFADAGCNLLGAQFGSTVHDDLCGADTGADGLGELRDEVVAYQIDDCEVTG